MKIFIHDEFNPEDMAMMQALYSRSAESVELHAEKVRKSGSGKFMESFYVGYGHASIGDCGSTTLFIEGVSMLAAKAIQDWPLYSGQETSSRYIDMSKQALVDPIGTPASAAVQKKWMDFYVSAQEKVKAHIRAKYPRKADEDEKVYERAVKARAFDTLRAFLPAGITTQLSWHTNLRQAHDRNALLRYYPLAEIREISGIIQTKLQEKYPHSFVHKQYEKQEAYRKLLGEKYTFYSKKDYAGDFVAKTNIKKAELAEYSELIKKRPEKTNLPVWMGELGNVAFDFLMDFGSFRDIHRHRNGTCRMPLLSTKFGFNEWYLAELPDDVRKEAKALIKEQTAALKKIAASGARKEDLQYLTAIGFNVSCRVSYGLPATIYVTELRSGRLVHPTLRVIAHKMDKALRKMFPGIVLFSDLSKDDWDVRRGKQDIVEKKPGMKTAIGM